MFINFYYTLLEAGIAISPTSFLKLHKAMTSGLINSLDDFYSAARTILIKSERYFDRFDQVFAHYFQGADLPSFSEDEFDDIARTMIEGWLQNPKVLAEALGIDESTLSKLSPEELIEYFKQRLKEQSERHDGGNKWIGTGGTSPVGHSGFHPQGMRVGGYSRNQSAIKIALERRYKDYAMTGPLTISQIGEALKRLRHLVPYGPKDRLNISETIYQTMKNGGEIEIIYERDLRNRLKVILMIDNGGWSMDPYIPLVQTLFNYARSQFKDLTTYFFHNTIYSTLWKDASRYKKPQKLEEFSRFDPETRLIIVGDASMAPYELMITDGSLYVQERSGKPSIECLRYLAKLFNHAVWLNPLPITRWPYTQTIATIRTVFPMFPLSLDGVEDAVSCLMK